LAGRTRDQATPAPGPRAALRVERNFHLPDYVDKWLALQVAEKGKSRSQIVVEALSRSGCPVEPIDLEDLRKNPKARG
jgi:hypothetical protein